MDFKRPFRRWIWHLHKRPGCAERTRRVLLQKTRGLYLCSGNKSPGYSHWLITTRSRSHFNLAHLQHTSKNTHIWYAIVLINIGASACLGSECKFSRLKDEPVCISIRSATKQNKTVHDRVMIQSSTKHGKGGKRRKVGREKLCSAL